MFKMARLFTIHSKLQTMKSSVKGVNRMREEERILQVGNERWMLSGVECSRKTSVRDDT